MALCSHDAPPSSCGNTLSEGWFPRRLCRVQNQHLSLLPDSLWPVQTGLPQAHGTVYFALWAVHTFLWARLPVLSPLTTLPFRRCGFWPRARVSSPPHLSGRSYAPLLCHLFAIHTRPRLSFSSWRRGNSVSTHAVGVLGAGRRLRNVSWGLLS